MNDLMSKIVSLCKRRGFIFQSSEIYGGLNSCYDYGPLGTILKNSVKSHWMNAMTREHTNILPLDSSILMHPKIWEASGHVSNFSDPLVDCKTCKARFRADKLESSACGQKPSKKPTECGGELTEPRQFNLMFKTFMGPLEDSSAVIFLRPETAQGIYVNFLNVMTSCRQQIPFGIAQIGKAFRNEITPGNFVFRMREFEQMEMQYFVHESHSFEEFERWKQARIDWHVGMGLRKERLRFHQHGPNELAHYAKAAFDIEYEFPFGWQEIEGVHHRSDFDLKQHEKFAGKKLSVRDPVSNEAFVPNVIETSVGCDRATLTLLIDAYHEEKIVEEGKEETRVVLKFSPKIAPFKASVFPLMKKDPMSSKAEAIFKELNRIWPCDFDASGSIGKRYRRVDEIGTPFAVTVDYESDSVTVRHRDSMKQERVSDSGLIAYLKNELKSAGAAE